MNSLAEQLVLKERLPRTWPAFFARYGTFTATQVAAIPLLLAGQNLLLCAATASGKTEAALAPLIERHCPPVRPTRLAILYLTPTRALASDLHARLAHPLSTLGLRMAIRTSDRSSFRPKRPPDLLITTPESADSLLASSPRLFANLRAVVIDELHLLDQTPRGDQLRVLLRRIQRIRSYAATQGDAHDAALQQVALSATIEAPELVAARYLDAPTVAVVPGQRHLQADLLPLSPVGAEQLIDYLTQRQSHRWRKALVFCNSRAEVETYAAAIRTQAPFGGVFVHYSSIDPQLRAEIEQRFAAAEAAICVASSTLELGIDIGTIDLVILIGPPGSWSSFTQRIGRGGRRSALIHVACFYRTSLEQHLFEALLEQTVGAALRPVPTALRPAPTFRPAVAVQQIFSLIKQSPTAAVRPADLALLFAEWLSRSDLEQILGELEQRGFVQPGRPGEWRAGSALNDLIDSQASATPGPSIHSNIQASAARTFDLRDQQTGRMIARVEVPWRSEGQLIIEGRTVSIEWSDGDVLLVRSQPGGSDTPLPLYRSARQPLSYALAQQLPAQLNLAGAAALVEGDGRWLLFHWLGDVYGRALLDLVRYRMLAAETDQIGLCIQLNEGVAPLTDWNAAQVERYLNDTYRTYEPLLDLGPFQHLLPLPLRKRVVVEQFEIARFLTAVQRLRPTLATPEQADPLIELLD